MALSANEIAAFIDNGAIVEYYTLGDRLPIRARYERDGSEGVWISQILGGKKDQTQVSTAKARSWASADDFRIVRGG